MSRWETTTMQQQQESPGNSSNTPTATPTAVTATALSRRLSAKYQLTTLGDMQLNDTLQHVGDDKPERRL